MPVIFWQCFCVFVGLTVSALVVIAEDEPDFRTLPATPSVWLFESPEIRKHLDLTPQQTTQINALLDNWKSIYLKAKQEHEAKPTDEQRTERTGRNRLPITSLRKSISEVLNDEQFQVFSQMRWLWHFSPVRSGEAMRYKELKLSVDQHRQLFALNIRWVLLGLAELKGQYRAQRPGVNAASGRRRFSVELTYYVSQTRLAWKFKPIRDAEWSRILTQAQARRWKELELQSVFARDPFVVMLTDYASRQEGRIPQTGKSDDYFVPYFTSPAGVLNLSEESRQEIQKLISEFQDWKTPPSGNREEWKAWVKELLQRQVQFMTRIQSVMSPEQRTAWWNLVGEPGDHPFFNSWEASKRREAWSQSIP